MPNIHRGVILGLPSNSRRMVRNPKTGKLCLSAKSLQPRKYVDHVRQQLLKLDPLLNGPLAAALRMYAPSESSSFLDPSLVFRAMEGFIYCKDRQVREFHVTHCIDRERPRLEWMVRPGVYGSRR